MRRALARQARVLAGFAALVGLAFFIALVLPDLIRVALGRG